MKKRDLSRLIKKNLGTFFHQHGFSLYAGDTAYKISDGIFQGVYFLTGAFGSDSMTLEIFVMPLFKRHEFVALTIGQRICFLCEKYGWWDLNCSEDQRKVIFEEVKEAIQQCAFPWLRAHETAKKILEVEKWNLTSSFPLTHCALWDKNWELAMDYLKRDDEWFKSSDDRRDWVVKQNREVKRFIRMIEAKQYDKIEKKLRDNLAFSIKALQIEKKTTPFKEKSKRIA